MPLNPDLDPLFQSAADQYNVDPNLLKAVALTESGGNTGRGVVSSVGAQGLMQFMPGTAKAYGVADPFDPSQAIPGAAHYISDLLSRAEKQGLQGTAAVSRALGGYYGKEDPNYIGTVARHYSALASAPPAVQTQEPSGGGSGSEAPAWAGDSDLLKGTVTGAGGQPMHYESAGSGGVKLVPDQAPQGQTADPLNDPTIQGIINGTIKLPNVAPVSGPAALAAVPAQPAAAGTPIMNDSALATMLNGAYATPAMAGAVGPLVTALGQGLPRTGGFQKILQANGQVGLAPYPGYVQGEAQVEGAKAAAAAGAKVPAETLLKEIQADLDRRNAASAPQKLVPGEALLYPPGSPNASISSAPDQLANAAHPAGSAPLAVASAPGGGSVVTGAPPNETSKDYYAELTKLGDQASAARQGQYQADLLKQQLHAIGTTGPATEYLAHLGAIAEQFGVSKDTVENYIKSANVQNANKLSQDLLGEVLKSTFPQRITNTDITAWQNTVPRATTLQEANDFLLDNVLAPKFQRDIDRYGAAVNTDMEHTPLHLQRFLNSWDNDHPYRSFVSALKPADDATLAAAKAAIAKGASRDAVAARLRQNGFDPGGL